MSPLLPLFAAAASAAALTGRTASPSSSSTFTAGCCVIIGKKSSSALLANNNPDGLPPIGASSVHHLFAPGRKSRARIRQFSIVRDVLRTLPLPPNSNPPPGLPPPVPHRNPSVQLKPTYALIVSYDGAAFPGGYELNRKLEAPTVQGVLTERISDALGPDHASFGRVKLAASGRTDALVSAKATMMTFHVREELPATFLEDVNSMGNVDGDIVVHSVTPVHASFHASFGGTAAREYVYVLPLLPDGTILDDGEGNMSNYDCTEEYAVRLATAVNVLLSDEIVGTTVDYVGMMSGKVTTQTTLCAVMDAGCWYYDGDGNMLVGGGGGSSEGGNDEEVAPSFGDCWRAAARQSHHRDDDDANADRGDIIGDDDGDDDDDDDCPGWAGCLVFRVKSDRFLRRMMRKVINSLLQEATSVVSQDLDRHNGGDGDCADSTRDWKGRWRQRVEAQDRSGNAPAPPQGLCFWRVEVE